MPTSKVIRPAVFDETGEHVIPADADLNLDPVSSDPDNYIVRGSDGGAFLNGDGVLSNDGENLLRTSPNDGKVTYPRSDAVSLINETVQPSLDKLEDEVGAASDKADKAQARADAAYDKASDAQCAAADALEKAQEAVDKLPEIADEHATVVTAGDGIKVDHTKNLSHNVYQVSVKRNGEDSGLISSTDGLEVELKGNGGIDKDKDGLYVDQQWLGGLLAGYVHNGNTVKLTGDATGTGTVDANGNVVVPTAVSHAASADKTTGGTVSITGYVSGSGSFDRNGNVTVAVSPNISDTPSTYYVGKTNARDYWGKDENGNQWGTTKDHPFATLAYAINQTNAHTFPGNTLTIEVVDSGDYVEQLLTGCHVTTTTYILHNLDRHPRFIGGWDFSIQPGNILSFDAIDFEIAHSTTPDYIRNGQVFIRVGSGGIIQFSDGCHMSISDDNFGMNLWPFIQTYGLSGIRFIAGNGKKEPALYCELANGATLHAPVFRFDGEAGFDIVFADDNTPVVKIVSPAGTKISGSVITLGRFTSTGLLTTPYPNYKLYFDWDIADDSELTQVDLGKFASLTVRKNPDKGVALPGHAVGSVPELADYAQWDY